MSHGTFEMLSCLKGKDYLELPQSKTSMQLWVRVSYGVNLQVPVAIHIIFTALRNQLHSFSVSSALMTKTLPIAHKSEVGNAHNLSELATT